MFASPGATAIEIGPIAIRWYGLLIMVAIIVGTALAYREASRRGANTEQLLDVVFVGVLTGLVGGRLCYVFLHWEVYAQDLMRVLVVWEGGWGIEGVVLGGLLGIGVYSRLKGLPLLSYLDLLAPPAALAQAIGRWGNFFNEEAFGTPTHLPWKLYIDAAHRPVEFQRYEYFHPTFLYESLWDFLIFTILAFVSRRRLGQTPGALVLAYLGLYSLGRFFIEALRVDSEMLGPFRAAQVLSVLLFLVSVGGLVHLDLTRRARRQGASR